MIAQSNQQNVWQVATTTLALEEFGAENIPYMYIAVAGANVVVVPTFTWVGTKCVLLSKLLPLARLPSSHALMRSRINSGWFWAQIVSKNNIVDDCLGNTGHFWRIVDRLGANTTGCWHGT